MTYELWQRRVDALGQFRVVDVATPLLSKDDRHHLRTVLRAKAHEEIVVTDGKGTWALCQVGEGELLRVSDVYRDPVVEETVLYMAPLKGDRSEWVIAKATELGVSRIVPIISERIVVKFKGDAKDKILSRWRRIANEAAGQCRRTYDLIIDEPLKIGDVPVNVCVADFGGSGDWSGVRAVAIGPEGGWATEEWGNERRFLSLGPTVLRGETAGVVAASLMAFDAGRWGFTVSSTSNE